jgi:hypothetical protein
MVRQLGLNRERLQDVGADRSTPVLPCTRGIFPKLGFSPSAASLACVSNSVENGAGRPTDLFDSPADFCTALFINRRHSFEQKATKVTKRKIPVIPAFFIHVLPAFDRHR